MIKSYVSASSLLLSCFAFVFFGIAAIIWRESLLSIVYLVTSGLLVIAGVVQLVTSVSVSYTHLDVYKRQAYGRAQTDQGRGRPP